MDAVTALCLHGLQCDVANELGKGPMISALLASIPRPQVAVQHKRVSLNAEMGPVGVAYGRVLAVRVLKSTVHEQLKKSKSPGEDASVTGVRAQVLVQMEPKVGGSLGALRCLLSLSTSCCCAHLHQG